ncbi:hypothetical protein [Bacillus massiliigorillae]|uniref:hypothetical protein n=1 Tax=Bacillus massiliigorillae TaxID=1243664 RepID=UPI0003A11138|nr:hypothetical protein [Bacillus massiliigorillae]
MNPYDYYDNTHIYNQQYDTSDNNNWMVRPPDPVGGGHVVSVGHVDGGPVGHIGGGGFPSGGWSPGGGWLPSSSWYPWYPYQSWYHPYSGDWYPRYRF